MNHIVIFSSYVDVLCRYWVSKARWRRPSQSWRGPWSWSLSPVSSTKSLPRLGRRLALRQSLKRASTDACLALRRRWHTPMSGIPPLRVWVLNLLHIQEVLYIGQERIKICSYLLKDGSCIRFIISCSITYRKLCT